MSNVYMSSDGFIFIETGSSKSRVEFKVINTRDKNNTYKDSLSHFFIDHLIKTGSLVKANMYKTKIGNRLIRGEDNGRE